MVRATPFAGPGLLARTAGLSAWWLIRFTGVGECSSVSDEILIFGCEALKCVSVTQKHLFISIIDNQNV